MSRTRQYLVFFFLISSLVLLLTRLFYLQVISYERFSEMAAMQHNRLMVIEPRRGTIFDRYMEPLAVNLDALSVYCDPRGVTDKAHVADVLSRELGVPREELMDKLRKDKAFIWVKRKVDDESASRIRALDLEGVYFLNESKRNYPNDDMASHVIGFVGIDNDGLEGLELSYDNSLKGKPGWRHLIRDARRRTVLMDEKNSIPPQNGYNVVLTIDSVIQYIVECELAAMSEKFNVMSSSCVVMEPFSGRVLAMANYPAYDLNDVFSMVSGDTGRNDAIASVYEPGSVFKIVTASAVLNEGITDLDETVFCENGEYRVGGRILHDFHGYGDLPVRDVVAKSSNIGTVKLAQRLGPERLYEYIKKFGFGRKTGIDLPGEVGGINRHPAAWSGSDISTIPIGQGIAVTPLQLACAVSVIANGGYLMKPYVVERVTTWEGEIYGSTDPVIVRKVLDGKTCSDMKEAMTRVITDGTGRRARSGKYVMCGKTGTAQMVDPGGGYFDRRYNASFIGFAPAEDPVIAVVITARDPHPVYFGGSVAGPAFKNISERVVEYLRSQENKDPFTDGDGRPGREKRGS